MNKTGKYICVLNPFCVASGHSGLSSFIATLCYLHFNFKTVLISKGDGVKRPSEFNNWVVVVSNNKCPLYAVA